MQQGQNSVRFKGFLSTPSARRATHCETHDKAVFCISIHALREEGDLSVTSCSLMTPNFYPRPPRGGRRIILFVVCIEIIFLSTPSARRATSGSRFRSRG